MRAPEVPNAKQTGENSTVTWRGALLLDGKKKICRLVLGLGYPTIIFHAY